MTRLVSFCFDDGFRRTAETVRSVFGRRGLAAAFCVLSAPELAADPFIRAAPIADWGVWREAAAAGHEIGPHGHAHEHLGRQSLEDAQAGVLRALEAFERELPGFRPAEAIFHLAYLTAPELAVAWLGERMLGVRAGVDGTGLNRRPSGIARGGVVNGMTFGPDEVDRRLNERVERFLAEEEGWLVLVLHGLDGEGWGTLATPALERVLDRLMVAGARIEPPARVLKAALAQAA